MTEAEAPPVAEPTTRPSTRETAQALREEYAKPCGCCGRKFRQVDLAKKYGLAQSTVSQIISGKIWA